MLAYVTLGTRDLDRAAAFYDALLPLVGGKRMMEEAGYYIAWSDGSPNAGLGIADPFDSAQATVGNGARVARQAPRRKTPVTAPAGTPQGNGGAASL